MFFTNNTSSWFHSSSFLSAIERSMPDRYASMGNLQFGTFGRGIGKGLVLSPKETRYLDTHSLNFFAYVSRIRNAHNVPLALLQVLLRVLLAGDTHPFWLV